jgi:hypothetical protein
LGCLISFIKFANSDSIAQLQLTVLAKYVNNISITSADDPTKLYGGYLSLLFSFGQLVGGILVGLFLIKKIGKT